MRPVGDTAQVAEARGRIRERTHGAGNKEWMACRPAPHGLLGGIHMLGITIPIDCNLEEETNRSTPPAGHPGQGVLESLAGCERPEKLDHHGRPWLWRSDVEYARFVVSATSAQSVPALDPENRPGSDGSDVHSGGASRLGALPALEEPAH